MFRHDVLCDRANLRSDPSLGKESAESRAAGARAAQPIDSSSRRPSRSATMGGFGREGKRPTRRAIVATPKPTSVSNQAGAADGRRSRFGLRSTERHGDRRNRQRRNKERVAFARRTWLALPSLVVRTSPDPVRPKPAIRAMTITAIPSPHAGSFGTKLP